MVTYWNKIQDYLAWELYSEFGYDTCKAVEPPVPVLTCFNEVVTPLLEFST